MKKKPLNPLKLLLIAIALFVLIAGSFMAYSYHKTQKAQADYEQGDRLYELQRYDLAAHWLRKAAEQGNIAAQRQLGYMYQEGKGVRQDYFEAFKWYQEGTEAKPDHFPQDYFKSSFARSYDRKFNKTFIALTQNQLGWMYHEGKGVRRDDYEAKKWFGIACDNKLQRACDNYANL